MGMGEVRKRGHAAVAPPTWQGSLQKGPSLLTQRYAFPPLVNDILTSSTMSTCSARSFGSLVLLHIFSKSPHWSGTPQPMHEWRVVPPGRAAGRGDDEERASVQTRAREAERGHTRKHRGGNRPHTYVL